jgi:putative flavoprotein involved in K+ transport
MSIESVGVVVVGAGQAGLATSYLLTEADISHIVFERGLLGESWRSQRWDSFALNTPNWANVLPGPVLEASEPDAFAHRDELVAFFERYASSFAAPVRDQTAVTSVERQADGRFEVNTAAGSVDCASVVVCSGSMSAPNVPAVAGRVPEGIKSLSGGEYRNAQQLAPGAVVVVGSGQTGCQIVEDLLDAGREVYLCASRVGRIPRTYRGRDILAWWKDMGFLDVRVGDLEDPNAQYAAQPQVSGTRGGHTISLQSLARDGATLLGRVDSIDGTTLRLRATLAECVEFADQKCATFKAGIDKYIEDNGSDAPPAATDPYEPPMPDLKGSEALEALDLEQAGVCAVIWCTGFRGDFSWIRHDILNERGLPRHEQGCSDIPGLYFVGFPWLRKRKSGILHGIAEDARYVVDAIKTSP